MSVAAFVFLTLKADGTAQKAVGVAADQLREMQEEQRPWIEIEPDIIGAVTLSGETLNVQVKLVLKNTGHTPATGIEIQPVLVMITSGAVMSKEDDIERAACATANARNYQSRIVGLSVSPGGSREIWTGPTLAIRDIPEDSQHDGRHGTQLSVIGCIDYIDSTTHEHGQTGFRLLVAKRGENPSIPYMIYVEDGSLGADRVMVGEDMYGNYQK